MVSELRFSQMSQSEVSDFVMGSLAVSDSWYYSFKTVEVAMKNYSHFVQIGQENLMGYFVPINSRPYY